MLTSGNDSKEKTGETLILLAEQQDEKPKKDELIRARAYLSTDRLPAGGTCQIVVLLNVKAGWHINANPPQPDYLKPTKATFKSSVGVSLSDTKYPKGHGFQLDGETEEAIVYEGEIAIHGTLIVPRESSGKVDDMEIMIHYQACNEKGCQPPKTITLKGRLAVAKMGEGVKPINSKLFTSKSAARE